MTQILPTSQPSQTIPRSAPDPAGRQDRIVGREPRIRALPASELGEEALAIVQALRQAAGVEAAAAIPELVATLLRHPVLYSAHAALGVALLRDGALSLRHRELAILRTGWLCGAPFEWGEHVAMAKRAGLASADIERLTQAADGAGWDADDRAIVEAAEELHSDAMISDRVWAALSAFLDERQLIELVYVIGHYTKVAFIQNALRVRLAPGNGGLAAR